MYIDLLLLAIIICFVVDISGAMRKFKKPFSCSLCCIWWIGLIYLLVTRNFTIQGVAFVAFLSMMSSVITGFLLTLKELLNYILHKINSILS